MKKQFKGYRYIDEQPTAEQLVGRFAQNGISVPSSGRWIVEPTCEISEQHVKEILKRKSVLSTLFFGGRRDKPIIQVSELRFC